MMKRFLPVAVVLASLAVVAVSPCPSWAHSAPAASCKGIVETLQPFVDRHTLAGAVTLVASKDKVLSLDAVGYADVRAKTPMRPDSLFWIASMTKPITATALMMLVDEGKDIVETPTPMLMRSTGGAKGMPSPAGGLFSTAGDVATFCRMMLNEGVWQGKRYLSQESWRKMTSNQTEGLPNACGLGWAVSKKSNTFGHGGAYKTHMRIDLEHGLVMVFMVQHADWGEGGKQILPAFQQAATKAFGSVRPTDRSPSPSAK